MGDADVHMSMLYAYGTHALPIVWESVLQGDSG